MVTKTEVSEKDVTLFTNSTSSNMDDLFSVSNNFQEFKENSEKAFILKQLQVNNWNISKTADMLGIQRSHLYNKLKKYGIEKD
jgi:transcriptional regulator of acetoin/glycerol metabolism